MKVYKMRTLSPMKILLVVMKKAYAQAWKMKELVTVIIDTQKQLFRSVLGKRCSENMQQIYRRAPIPKCDFNKVAKQLFNTFSTEHLWMALSGCWRFWSCCVVFLCFPCTWWCFRYAQLYLVFLSIALFLY